jgi:hypothetical protein
MRVYVSFDGRIRPIASHVAWGHARPAAAQATVPEGMALVPKQLHAMPTFGRTL